MKIFQLKYFILFLSLGVVSALFGQGNVEDLLHEKVENINMVYKPVVGVGIGTFNFLGDVQNPNLTPFNGTFGYKVNLSTFIDNNNYIRGNFFFMLGQLTGNERSAAEIERNLNFKSDLLMFGINLNYDFDHFIKKHRTVHPFISAGFEILTFDSKTDLIGTENTPYHYWTDGSIRNMPQATTSVVPPLMQRDFKYETGLRDIDWGLGDYAQYAFALPFDVGLDFWLSDRVMFRVGTSYHLVFSDVIDHVSSENDPALGVVGDNKGDNFMFNYFSLHLDLFSSDRELEWNTFFADLDFDPTLMGDEDGDLVFDRIDDCPGTPYGIEVDSMGCAVDTDGDGIQDYLDDERNSRSGAMVDERGVEISEDEVIARLDQTNAVAREDISMYLRDPSSYANYKKLSSVEIPEKFKAVDANKDAYISFDEMMDAIDGFFDFDSTLGADDIYELNEFFFSQ